MKRFSAIPTGSNLKWKAAIRNLLFIWDHPAACFFLVFLGYFLLATCKGNPLQVSGAPYFNYLADAFLHGQPFLRLMPPNTNDLSLLNSHLYLYWGPFPAFLFMPIVAVLGVSVSDKVPAILAGALNATLVLLLFKAGQERGLFQLSRVQRTLLVLFFAFGTVHTALAPMGGVWFTAQVIGFTCLVFAYWVVLKYRGSQAFFLAGLGFACAFLSRNNMILLGIWPAWYLLREHWNLPRWSLVKLVVWGALPILAAVLFFFGYNWIRFGNVLDNGIGYQLMGDHFGPIFKQYGFFNPVFLPLNLYYQFIFYPIPWRIESYMGGSLFLLSPVYFSIFFTLWNRRRELSTWVLTATLIIGYIPIGILMGTGYGQIGPRYLSDLTVPLLLLTAPGIKKWPLWILAGLTVISIFSYITGLLIY
jgi:hypothetical protein